MIEAIKIRIYPSKKQRTKLNKTLGSGRFLYNKMLEERNEVYERLKDDKEALYDYTYKTEKQYKQEFPFLKEADSRALQNKTRNLITAFHNFFEGLNKPRKVGHPKFKSKKGVQKYTTDNVNNNIKMDFTRQKIKLPKVSWISFRDDRVFSGKIKHVMVSRTRTNQYFVAITLEAQDDAEPKNTIHEKYIAAFDMSAKDFLVNDAVRMKNPRFYRSVEKKTKHLHRNLSRKQKGSKNWEKTRLELATHYERIYNQKKDWTHKTTRDLGNKYDVIVLETLNIKGMQKFIKACPNRSR
ncbi:MAG: transposase [Promethearchaeota archaeon]|nr:MAG: transposase [Candidatus Lokiarchaeota archaeon]